MVEQTTFYDVYGLRIAVSGDPLMTSAIASRLRYFSTIESAPPDIRFELQWATATGVHVVERPAGQGRPIYEPDTGEVLYFDDQDQLYMNYDNIVRALSDLQAGQVQVSVLRPEHAPSLTHDPVWLVSHPMFMMPLMELLKRYGRYSLHAAGLTCDGRGILFPGSSGAGKSTLTVTLLRAGFGLMSDDMLFLTQHGTQVQVLGFPDEVDLTDQTIELFPELHHMLEQSHREGRHKRQLIADDMYNVEIIRVCQPAALVFPNVANASRSLIRSIDPAEALIQLAPNVLLSQAQSSQAHLDMLATLVRGCPCYVLETGRDFDHIPQLLAHVVRGVAE